MPEHYRHLFLPRLERRNPRRTKSGWPRIPPPESPREHARLLEEQLRKTADLVKERPDGFDPRLLLRLQVEGIRPQDLEAIPGLRLVSQEQKTLVVVFADESGLREFRGRLTAIQRGRKPVRQEILYAIKGIAGWSREDRTGSSLRREGVPRAGLIVLDVELWALESRQERRKMIDAFRNWCEFRKITVLDQLNQETVVLCRVRLGTEALEPLLEHRDVRLVDLPPRFQLNLDLRRLQLQDITQILAPEEEAPGVVVLDSGLATGHPLLAPAMGDAQSFIPGLAAEDENGHGTLVGGLALYGDLEPLAASRSFSPQLRLFSGRITDASGQSDSGFIENHIVEAVRYFTQHYGCKIFNLSFGDSRKPFEGGHVRGLAAVLDSLARQYGVLFVVSAGNFYGDETTPDDWRAEYPGYLLEGAARLLDPAPGLNVLTVGSLARYEIPRMGQTSPRDPAYQPLARKDQPSPFTRSGPGPHGAIKPEVAEYGGNQYVDLRSPGSGPRGLAELGELSLARDFAGGNLFGIDAGTSFAAPKITHLAGCALAEYPDASTDMIRALIVAHCHWPPPCVDAFDGNEESIYRVVGYGRPDPEAVLFSDERRVTLIREDEIEENQHHFYEVPLPADFLAPPARRGRRISVALAHTPMVRRTRIEYRASALEFRVVRRGSLEEVESVFRRTSREEREDLIPEVGQFRPSSRSRTKGSVQGATWSVRQVDARWSDQHLFVVVTRSVPDWALGAVPRERYALVVVIEDQSTQQVRYYSQIQQRLQVPRLRV